MTQLALARQAVDAATQAIWSRVRLENRAALTELHLKQSEEIEEDITEVLTPFFNDQMADIIRGVSSVAEPAVEEGKEEEAANRIVASVFNPDSYIDKLLDTIFPPLAEGMIEVMVDMVPEGFEPSERSYSLFLKESTATAWLESAEQSIPPGVSTEFPPWMIDEIREVMGETFAQPYWEKISASTGGDASVFIKNGLKDGKSIRTISNELKDKFPDSYGMHRAKRVAQTESGNALNGARKAGINALNGELPAEAQLQVSWLSILGDTTRDTHADLDGTFADSEGNFRLGGVDIPWPAYHSLPAGERIWCYCTLLTEFAPEQLPTGEGTGDGGGGTEPVSLEQRLANNPRLNSLTDRVANAGQEFDPQIKSLADEKMGIWTKEDGLNQLNNRFAEIYSPERFNDPDLFEELESIELKLGKLSDRIANIDKEVFALKAQARRAAEEAAENLVLESADRISLTTVKHSVVNEGRINVIGRKSILRTYGREYDEKLKEASEFLSRVVKTSDELPSVELRAHHLPKGGRAFYSSGDGVGSGIYLTKKHPTRTFVHEIGHGLEDKIPGAQDKANEFRRMRIARSNKQNVKLIDQFPDHGYSEDEVGNEDDWKESLFGDQRFYVGKRYERGPTEVMTMGLERLYENPAQFAREDPEYFKFIVGVIQGDL